MSITVVIGAGVLGGLGAIARFLLDGAVDVRVNSAFPYGTLAVNILGAFVLGILAGAALAQSAYQLLGVGLIGAFTTFSTWVLESHRLGEEGELALGAMNFAVSLALGILAVWTGRRLGAAL